MLFLSTLDTYEQDVAAKTLWERLNVDIGHLDGICYYKHPIISSSYSTVPDLTFLANTLEPVAIKIIDYKIEEIVNIEKDVWLVAGETVDSPIMEIEDFVIGLQHRFDKERELRKKLVAYGVIYFPHINKRQFSDRFGDIDIPDYVRCIWSDADITEILIKNDLITDENAWLLSKSVFQGINPINKKVITKDTKTDLLGKSIDILEKYIALLDDEQHKVAVQMAPGPQRIRGLAGTGKTVVLAMKAANIHSRYKDKRILFTFNTQSLYNQAKNLITKFYRVNHENDPNWELIHVRHGWGGSSRPGVYYELCKRIGVAPLTLDDARTINYDSPFAACCSRLLENNIEPYYDFILVDEAQDFPTEFFRLLARLITKEKRIFWAYDELQSLSATEVPSAEDLFGKDRDGNAFIALDGEDYPGNIEKDFVLHKSYRCPLEILMLAHGIGLGIHSPRNCVQMLGNKISWEAIGYEIKSGNLNAGEETVIYRDKANSPNRIREIYTGNQSIIRVDKFGDRNEELEYVANSIRSDIHDQGVKPEHIVVISLDSRSAKKYLMAIQRHLYSYGIRSTIPGIVDQSWEFCEEDTVTLSTVYRAKGNEAPIVYIISFDTLHGYAEEIETRNRAFTCISRSKGWVRITGAGQRMADVEKEIIKIAEDIPYFKFKFPDMDKIRKLDASETTRRKKIVSRAKKSVSTLLDLEKEAFSDIDPVLLKKLKEMLSGVGNDNK